MIQLAGVMSKKLCTRNNAIDGTVESDKNESDTTPGTSQNTFHCPLERDRETSLNEDSSAPRVKSLMDHCIAYIASNTHYVESFCGFPDIIGERIFKTALKHGTFSNDNPNLTNALKPFCDAYGSTVLETLSLCGQYLVLNNYLESIFLFMELTKLDISHCGLGDSHEMLHHISQLQSLETLIMRGNALTDDGLRKLTAPIRMFHQDLRILRYLDVSDNQLTDRGVNYLMCFTKMEIINLSANKIQNYNGLKVQGFHLSTSASNLCEGVFLMENKGWAAPLFRTWFKEWTDKSKAKKVRKSTFYGKHQQPECCPSSETLDHPVYTHVLVSDKYQPQTAKSKYLHKFKASRKMENGKDTNPSKLNINAVDHSSSVKLIIADRSPTNVSEPADQLDEDLLTMYGGYSKMDNKTPTLSGVLTQSW